MESGKPLYVTDPGVYKRMCEVVMTLEEAEKILTKKIGEWYLMGENLTINMLFTYEEEKRGLTKNKRK